MPILDVLIVMDDNNVLLRNTPVIHDCEEVIDAVIAKPRTKHRTTYAFKENKIFAHVLSDSSAVFLCLYTEEVSVERVHRLLDSIKELTLDKLSFQ